MRYASTAASRAMAVVQEMSAQGMMPKPWVKPATMNVRHETVATVRA